MTVTDRTTTEPPAPPHKPDLLRPEARLKVTGAAGYAADMTMPGMLWAAFTTSTVPHGRIVSIDTSAARDMPGVHAVLTGADIGPVRFGRRLQDWPVLAWERVRFVGERVAAVAAETLEIAEAAAQAIKVEYDELPAILDPEVALAADAPTLHPDADQYVYLKGTRPPIPHPNAQGRVVIRRGEEDLEAAFERADRVFEHVFTTPRQHAAHIEPRASLVWVDSVGVVHIVTSNKAPFQLRAEFASATGLPESQVEVDTVFIGGDFGGKGLTPLEFPSYYLARATGRPIKAVMSYVDELRSSPPRHAARIRLRTGVMRDGCFVAHEADVLFDGGAYAAAKPIPDLAMYSGPRNFATYRLPNLRMETTAVYTNTVPGGIVRAPGNVQVVFAWESHVDMIARELGIDPIEIRLRNVVHEGDLGPAGQRALAPRGAEVLETIRRETQWGLEPLPPNRGRGIAFFARHTGGGRTGVALRLRSDGLVEALTGVPDQGAGAHMMLQRVVAATLSIDPSLVQVVRGTTATAPWDTGVTATRVTHIQGQAGFRGATRLKGMLEDLAAEAMGWPSGDVRLHDGRFVVGDGAESLPYLDVARRIASMSHPVEAAGEYEAPEWPEPAHLCFSAIMVEVDVDPFTGHVSVREAISVADVGGIINPLAFAGQLDGGFVFGLSEALMQEQIVEDGSVTPLNLGEYKIACARDVPALRHVLLESPDGPGPFGARAVGELTNVGVPAAVANAVEAAVGARVTSLPITAERVHAALSSRRRAGSGLAGALPSSTTLPAVVGVAAS